MDGQVLCTKQMLSLEGKGATESLIYASHIVQTRHVHEVTTAALQSDAFKTLCQFNTATETDVTSMEAWCKMNEEVSPPFQHWYTVLEWELIF